MMDRRTTPANGRVAHVGLRGKVEAESYVEGEWARVVTPLANLLASPEGARDRQVLLGDRVLVLERHEQYAFVQAEKDGYCGYVEEKCLGPDQSATHWVAVPATHLYSTASIKRIELALLSLGAQLSVSKIDGKFAETTDGRFVPAMHLLPVGEKLGDPAAVAEMFLGTPYLWGGNSRSGIDCSGVVQAALLACGTACPGDSDLQYAAVGAPVSDGSAHRRGDLFFWKGHVAMAVDDERIIHANGFRMAVTYEGISEALQRISEQEGPDAFLGVRRL